MLAVRLALPVLPGAQCRRGAELAFLCPLLTARDCSRGAELPALLLFGAGRAAASLCQHTAASSIPSFALVAEGKGALLAQCPVSLLPYVRQGLGRVLALPLSLCSTLSSSREAGRVELGPTCCLPAPVMAAVSIG